jgi:Cys-tRNA(Pro)/Cys-tRNA(Cys) deacylase
MAGRGTPAIDAAKRAMVVHTIHEYEHDPAAASYGLEAADALGVDPARVFKTLLAAAGNVLVCAIVPVTGQLDLKTLAAAHGVKSMTMADPTAAERATGYVVGGISPLGQRKRHATYLDTTAAGFDTIYVSAGRRGLEIELAAADLLALTNGTLAPIGRTG